MHLYNYECAFCRLKVTKALAQNIVDGAHIKPFAKFYDNNVGNGISFCKNHHWAFDKGLFSVDDNFRIIVSDNFQEKSPNAKAMKDFHGEGLLLPISEKYHPRLEAIQWHRNNVFQA